MLTLADGAVRQSAPALGELLLTFGLPLAVCTTPVMLLRGTACFESLYRHHRSCCWWLTVCSTPGNSRQSPAPLLTN